MQSPIGVTNFRELINPRDHKGTHYLFVDKSLFIKDIIEESAKVILLTRPRRFGKTLNMSMLHHFFTKEVDQLSTEGLFKDLKIAEHQDSMLNQGRYPVIYLTFKDLKNEDFHSAYLQLCELISCLYEEHNELLSSPNLSSREKAVFESIANQKAGEANLNSSLKRLTRYLYLHYRVKPIVLIDEYDAPIQTGYIEGYYQKIVSFMRMFLGAGLKDNSYLEKAVLTGILRVSKESIFSGLNNLKTYSLLNSRYGEYFGFTEPEVGELLKKAGLSQALPEVRRWYNGYQCGDVVVYNPWSIIHYIESKEFNAYWVNTANNDLIKNLFIQSTPKFKEKFQLLLEDKSLEVTIDEHMIFDDLKKNENNIWTLLLMAGYLKAIVVRKTNNNPVCRLQIPNTEVRGLYQNFISEWFSGENDQDFLNTFLSDFLNGNMKAFTKHLKTIMLQIVSVYDVTKGKAETFYHGFMLGLVSGIEKDHYEINSNEESGLGRFDIMIAPLDPKKLGIIIEIKSLSKNKSEEEVPEKLQKAAEDAIQQIQNKCYNATLAQKGLKQCLNIGIAFRGKKFAIAHRFEALN